MTDLLGSAFEAVGRAAKPLQPALDFVMPDNGSGGGTDLSIGNLINSAGKGIQNSIDEGLVGLGAAAYNAATMRGLSARERLLLGGAAAVGGVMSARAVHAGWKANRLPQRMSAMSSAAPPSAPSGYGELVDGLGDTPRFVDTSPEAQELLYQRPGINRRQAQILAADDGLAVARGFAEFDTNDVERLSAAAGLFDTYAARVPEGARGAQVDWARFQFAYDAGLIRGTKGNARVRKLWKQAIESPETLGPEDSEELFGSIQQIADKTDQITTDDFAVGVTGRVSAIDFVDGEARFFVSHPVGWDDGMAADPLVRAKRLSQLNIRTQADRGHRMVRMLFDIGDSQYQLFKETGETTLPAPMHLGRDWYPTAYDDVAREFGINPKADPAAMDRAVAAVSFLSEAEEWSTNVPKARRILDIVGDVSDEDFQAWLRDGIAPDAYNARIPRHRYAGKRASANQKQFDRIWEAVKADGFRVDAKNMKKVLRLYGGVEPVDAVFRSTKGRKQKNFYENIRRPEGEWPVTIDRHAYDAFYGLDAGVQDRPIDVAVGAGDQQYDVIADTYRAVADELSKETGEKVLPHQVQAVIWEVWRILKKDHKGGWHTSLDGADAPSPFMMTLPGETSNPVFDALIGRDAPGAIGRDLSGPIPVSLLEASDVKGLSAASVGDETVVLADIDDVTAASVRSKTPGVVGADRVPRWVDSTPMRVESLEEFVATAAEDVQWLETTLVADHPGGLHPVLRPDDTIVAYVDDTARFRAPRGVRARRAGRAAVEAPELSFDRLGPDDIDPEKWVGNDSPLNTHAWAGISAELTPDQVAALGDNFAGWDNKAQTNRLRAELSRRGYKPITQEGFYGSPDPETSFLVFGITQREAREIGEMFGQDSVITNDGFLYNRSVASDPADVGRARMARGMELDPQPIDGEDFYRSELVIGGKRLKWVQDLDWDETVDVDDELLDQRRKVNRERIEVQVPADRDINELVADLESRGARDVSVYANRDRLNGFERAYDEVVTDGDRLTTVRRSTGAITSPHGSHVFVRSTSGLSKRPKQGPQAGWKVRGDGVAVANNTLMVDGRFPNGNVEFSGPFKATLDGQSPIAWGYTEGTLTPIFDELELGSGRFDATIQGKNVTPADEADLTPSIRAAQHLADAGYPEALQLKTSEGTYQFGKAKDTTSSSEVVTTRNGLPAPQTHNDVKVPRLERNWGLTLDVGWRRGNKVHRLDEKMSDQIEAGVGLVMSEHEQVVHRARLRGLSTENMDPKAAKANEVPYAYFPFGPDQQIVLTREFWENPKAFEAQLATDRAAGWLSPRVEPTGLGIIVHEMGHVMHLSARMGEGMVKNSPLEREIREMLGRDWAKIAEKEISTVAGFEISELIAESVSEVLLAPRPSKLATDVYQVLAGRLDGYMKHFDVRPGEIA